MELLRFELSDVPQGWELAGGVDTAAAEYHEVASYLPGMCLFHHTEDGGHVAIVHYWDGAKTIFEVQENERGTVGLAKTERIGPTLFRADYLAACTAWWAIEQSNLPAVPVKSTSQRLKETFTG